MNIINQIKNLEKIKEQEEKILQKEVENHLLLQDELSKSIFYFIFLKKKISQRKSNIGRNTKKNILFESRSCKKR